MAKLGKLKKRMNVMQAQLDCVTAELELVLEIASSSRLERPDETVTLSAAEASRVRRWQKLKRGRRA